MIILWFIYAKMVLDRVGCLNSLSRQVKMGGPHDFY
jgi:hypothetical protein